jgi:peptidoglycan/LPS O-acetylase OafA/YrhL
MDPVGPIAVAMGQQMAARQARPFFTRVESLRGVGALAIAAYHFSGYALHGVLLLPHQAWSDVGNLQNAVGRLVLNLIPGHAALMMFFVISGFVLQVSLQYGPQRAGTAAVRFLIARVFRIYPIVIFGTLVVALANGWQTPPLPDRPAQPLDVATLLENFLLLDTTMNRTLWALQVEVLMAPIIVLVFLIERAYGPVRCWHFSSSPSRFRSAVVGPALHRCRTPCLPSCWGCSSPGWDVNWSAACRTMAPSAGLAV